MTGSFQASSDPRPERSLSVTEQTVALVDEVQVRRLAEAHGLPEIEVDAALFGEPVQTAESVLAWIDAEEKKLVRAYGLLEGRARYKPLRMLKNYARKYGTGRR